MEKKACTFFGHRDCPETIKPKIRTAVINLIENHGVTMFYVGNQGNFDRMVRVGVGRSRPYFVGSI